MPGPQVDARSRSRARSANWEPRLASTWTGCQRYSASAPSSSGFLCAVLDANAAVSPLVPTQKPGRFGSDPYAPFYADLKFRFPVVRKGGRHFPPVCPSSMYNRQVSASFWGIPPPKSLTVERQPAVGLVAARAGIISTVPGVHNDLVSLLNPAASVFITCFFFFPSLPPLCLLWRLSHGPVC